MNIPLNIDLQQILLHWLNLAILVGGLYFLLYKPVKDFMQKRQEHYQELERQAQEKLQEAERVQAEYQSKLDGVEEELHEARQKAQQAVQKSADEQLALAQAQAREIVVDAHAQAAQAREKALRDSQRELKRLAAQAAEKLAFHPETDAFDQFLDLTEGGGKHEG